jgi:hypothetical protein
MMGTFVIRDQLTFMQNINLGIKKDNIIYMNMRGKLRNDHDTFKTELGRYPEIKNVAASSGLPINLTWATTGVDWEGKDPDFRIHWQIMSVDFEYIDMFGLEVVGGREFSREISTDSQSAYIINETGAKTLGHKNVIGKSFSLWDNEGTIIGIVKDFHMSSLRENIQPLIMKVNSDWDSYVFVKVDSSHTKNILAKIEGIHRKMNPDYPFQFGFLDAEMKTYTYPKKGPAFYSNYSLWWLFSYHV